MNKMPFGSILKHNYKGNSVEDFLMKNYLLLFGCRDLHTHIRWRAIKPLLQKTERNVEIGVGSGLMTFAFAQETGKPILGVAYSEKELESCEEIRKNARLRGISFVHGDILNFKLRKFDQVLLIDVLEHIEDDFKALKNVNRALKPGGYLVISVPTPLYPKYFGHKFADLVGHVRDGYALGDLEIMLRSTGFKILEWHHHTNPSTAKLCSLWYKQLRNPFLKWILMPPLNILSTLDLRGPLREKRQPIRSCGIALLAQKMKDV